MFVEWSVIPNFFSSSLGLDVDDEDEAPAEHVETPAAAEAVSSSAMEEID